jgi:hypothetical protein
MMPLYVTSVQLPEAIADCQYNLELFIACEMTPEYGVNTRADDSGDGSLA